MFKYIALISLLALTACSSGNDAKTTESSPSNTESTASQNPVVTLNYTLREGSPTGPILETTIEEVAKANNLYRTGAAYSPFVVTLGEGMVIPGFENGISSMAVGEKKMIEVLPKDGYGEAVVVETVKEGQVAPKFTLTSDITRFQDTVTEVVQRSALGEEGVKLTVGQTLTGGQNVTAKVSKIEGDIITLEIENRDNPFYGQKLATGLSAEKDGVIFKITELTGTSVTLDIENKNSPFYGKEFVAGATAELPPTVTGMDTPATIKILSIEGDNVSLEMPNMRHPLAGKTLYFDVEILDKK